MLLSDRGRDYGILVRRAKGPPRRGLRQIDVRLLRLDPGTAGLEGRRRDLAWDLAAEALGVWPVEELLTQACVDLWVE